MSLEIYNGNRSEQSVQFEKWFTSESNKKSFSSIENTKQFIEQMGTENVKPYAIGDAVQILSDVKERAFEGMQLFTLNDQESIKQKVILFLQVYILMQ